MLEDQVVVVGGGTGAIGQAVVQALLDAGARVIVPVPGEAAAERFYLDARPATVPRLRAVVGEDGDAALPARIAATARRDFGRLDHLVAAFDPPSAGTLAALDPEAVRAAVEDGVARPARFILSLLRHLSPESPVRNVVAVVSGTGQESDVRALPGRVLDALFDLLARTPGGVHHHVLRSGGADPAEVARAVVERLANPEPPARPIAPLEGGTT